MFTKTQRPPANSPPAGTDTIATRANGESPVTANPQAEPAAPRASTQGETGREHFRRKAHRSRLHAYAIIAVILVACLIALAVANTARIKVDWVFGSSHVSLVWLVLCAAFLGWLLGLVVTAAFHWRTRAPRSRR
ncbi:MAG TPA: LapA family protein [Nocardioidaceae bacterium]|nr:LapA family protein [Nocardioidaceae bacterium]